MPKPTYSIESNWLEIERVFKAFPVSMARASKQTLEKEGTKGIRELQVKHLTGGTSPDRLAVRTGNLRRSWWRVVIGNTLNTLALVFVSDSPYAAVHEFGATIKAKAGKALAIPLGDATTDAGVAKWPSPRSPGAPPMHLIVLGGKNTRSGKGLALLVHSISGEPMYLLKKSVVIPPRMHATETFEDRLPLMVAALGRTAETVWRRLT
jgi:phage gpG-like protein